MLGDTLRMLKQKRKASLCANEMLTDSQDLLEKETATHSSTLAWKIPRTEEPVGYSPWGHKESGTTERLHFLFFQAGQGE